MRVNVRGLVGLAAFVAMGVIGAATATASTGPVVNVCPKIETVETHNPTDDYMGGTSVRWADATDTNKKKISDAYYPDFDSVDDAAVWIHPSNPAQSLIINVDKSDHGGYNLYNLDGSEHHWVSTTASDPSHRLNNVDIRYNFPLGGQRVALVGFSVRDRTNPRLSFYRVDVATRKLVHVGSPVANNHGIMPRGFAMYHSPNTGKYYAFVTDSGKTDQYELDGSSGTVKLKLVRTLQTVTMSSEGLVADDEMAFLYLAEESNSGQTDPGHIWKFQADPGASTVPSLIATTTDGGGVLTPDIKGLSLYYADNGNGYLIAASQGKEPGQQYSSFGVFSRKTGTYLGSFALTNACSIDQVTGEDGIDVTNFNLGPAFPKGMFITGDFDNKDGAVLKRQNNKVVAWEDIANAFSPKLLIDNTWDPRLIGADGAPPGDLAPPTVALTAPADGDTVSGQIALSATASDAGSGVARVQFTVDGTVVATDTTAPYSVTWNTGTVSNANHVIGAIATDGAGNAASAAERTVRVANVLPPRIGTRIVAIAVTGGPPTLIAQPPAGSYREAAYSVGRTRIAFVGPQGIVIARRDGTGQRVLPGTVGARHPAWGPRNRVVFYVKRGSIYRRAVGSRATVRLVAGRVAWIAASPDGRQIAYQRRESNGRGDIWTVASTGRGARNVTRSRTLSEAHPTWINGRTLAFARSVRGLWVVERMAAAGGTRRVVTRRSLNCQRPAYSPNGSWLACVQVGRTSSRLMVVRATGAAARALPVVASRPTDPVWGSSTLVAYTTN